MHENVKKILLRGDFVPCNTGYLSNAVAHTYSSIHYKCTTTFCPRLFDIITVSEDDHVACRCYAP